MARPVIDFNILRPMDVVLTSDRGIFPYVTRLLTAGWKKRHSLSVATHTGFVVKRTNLYEIAEMSIDPQIWWPKRIWRARGIFSKFSKYTTGKWGKPRIIAIKRFPEYDDREVREKASARVINNIVRIIKYDYEGLLEFAGICDDDKRKSICSELIRDESIIDGVKWKPKLMDKISPYDIQLDSNSGLVVSY